MLLLDYCSSEDLLIAIAPSRMFWFLRMASLIRFLDISNQPQLQIFGTCTMCCCFAFLLNFISVGGIYLQLTGSTFGCMLTGLELPELRVARKGVLFCFFRYANSTLLPLLFLLLSVPSFWTTKLCMSRSLFMFLKSYYGARFLSFSMIIIQFTVSIFSLMTTSQIGYIIYLQNSQKL